MDGSRRKARAFGIAVLGALGFTSLACDTKPSFPCVNPVAAGAGYVRCENGSKHRPEVAQCASSLPRPDVVAEPTPDDECKSDADCTGKPHGYCQISRGPDENWFCRYGCVSDSECGAGICVCGDPVGHCAEAKCRTDADCEDGFNCQSYDPTNGCGGEAFACQTADDTCGAKSDCQSGHFCSANAGAFKCEKVGCVVGRPFLVGGEERKATVCVRADWATPIAVGDLRLSSSQRAAAAKVWARTAQLEHASVAAFARFALQLLQLGAPPSLVGRATQAMADETRHARLAFGIASELAGEGWGPAPLDVSECLVETSLVDVARLVIREGCVGETYAALEARAAAEDARPELGPLLLGVAEDEARHAELAWRFVAWALSLSPGPVAAVLRAELARASADLPAECGPPSADDLALVPWGVVPESRRFELQRAAFHEVLAPCGHALLERAAGKLAESQVVSA